MAGTYSKHTVEVETLFKQKGGKRIEESTKRIEKLGRGIHQTTTETTKFDSKGRGMVTTTSKMTKGFERFQMEQLGVMFGGMALNRAMNTLNATSREWLGIGELTSTMMGITMLDANIDLLEYGVLPLFEALTNLPPEAQKAIGYLSFALEGLGALMMVGGQLMLGLDSSATLLSKIAGVQPELIFTEKGLSSLKKKLGVISPKITKLAKYGATGITIAMALQDLAQGDITAAIGDGFMAAGFLKGGKVGGALFIAGLGLKLIGEDAFSSSIAKLGITMLDTFMRVIEWTGDAIRALFSTEEIDWGAAAGLFGEFDKVASEKILAGEKTSRFLVNRINDVGGAEKIMMNQYGDDLDKINEKYVYGGEAWITAVSNLESEYTILFNYQDELIEKQERSIKLWNEMPRNIKSFFGIQSSVSDTLLTNKPEYQQNNGMSIRGYATGGPIRKTGPYYLHEGEEVIPKTDVSSGQITVQTTYNVNVSDKREFEDLLRKNNQQLTSEVRRIVRV